MNLQNAYQHYLQEHHYQSDPAQRAVLEQMQRIGEQLQHWDKTPNTEQTNFFSKLFKSKQPQKNIPWVKGLYCYGGVGRGKTLLMDLFYNHLPTPRKRRQHFHHFMLELHNQLNQTSNQENPINHIIQTLAQKIDLLCLDEFFISDITDAMLFVRLFDAMKRHGITLVTTSNIAPDNLYKNGLQRQSFLPAIEWIKTNLIVYHIEDGEDYRQRHYNQDNLFLTPDNPKNRQKITEQLQHLNHDTPPQTNLPFQAGSRKIPALQHYANAITFEFNTLCAGNYSQKDYIEIAKTFPYVALLNIPILTSENEDAAKRFLLLIDEFYDRNVKLLITSATPPENLYQGKQLRFEFQRLQSRLFEMQSQQYWQQAHQQAPNS